MANFLENTIIPYYRAQAKKEENFILYDLNLRVIVAADSVAKRLKYQSPAEIEGKTYQDFAHIKPELIPKLEELFTRVVKSKQVVTVLGIGGQLQPKYKNYHELILQNFEPILDPEQEVVAVLAKKLPTMERNLIHLLFPEFKVNLHHDPMAIESFTQREFEILYLLSNGFSQYEIAAKLGITRGTVMKTISDRILAKLSLNENNSLAILKMAITLGVHAKIPKSLVKEQLIVL